MYGEFVEYSKVYTKEELKKMPFPSGNGINSHKIEVSIASPFGLLTLKSMKSAQMEPNHYDQVRTKYQLYYSMGSKDINVYINGKKTFNLTIDERHFNVLYYTGQNIEHEKIYLFVLKHFNQMKLSNPNYGTYDIKTRKSHEEGSEPLLTHHFFQYLQKYTRTNKIKRVLESNDNL